VTARGEARLYVARINLIAPASRPPPFLPAPAGGRAREAA
jgi:hypothetical protein